MVVELGGVERSGDEELFRFATGGITVVANILVEKLAALIVPHVDDDASVVSEKNLRTLMFETAERRTLFGRRTRIERIDFHDIAVPIRLVGMFRDIEAFVGCRPPEPSVRMLYAISLEDGVELFVGVAGGMVTVEVLLTGQLRAPRGAPATTIVEGAENTCAGGVRCGF